MQPRELQPVSTQAHRHAKTSSWMPNGWSSAAGRRRRRPATPGMIRPGRAKCRQRRHCGAVHAPPRDGRPGSWSELLDRRRRAWTGQAILQLPVSLLGHNLPELFGADCRPQEPTIDAGGEVTAHRDIGSEECKAAKFGWTKLESCTRIESAKAAAGHSPGTSAFGAKDIHGFTLRSNGWSSAAGRRDDGPPTH